MKVCTGQYWTCLPSLIMCSRQGNPFPTQAAQIATRAAGLRGALPDQFPQPQRRDQQALPHVIGTPQRKALHTRLSDFIHPLAALTLTCLTVKPQVREPPPHALPGVP